MAGRGLIAGSPPTTLSACGGGAHPDDHDDDGRGHDRHDGDDPWPSCRRSGRHVVCRARAIDLGHNGLSGRASNADSRPAQVQRNQSSMQRQTIEHVS